MSDEDIKDCTACGWWCKKVWRFSNNQCDPKLGEIARSLADMVAKLPNVTTTIQGYGYGNMAITVGKDRENGNHFMLVLDVGKRMSIERLFWSRSDKPETIAALVGLLAQFDENNP